MTQNPAVPSARRSSHANNSLRGSGGNSGRGPWHGGHGGVSHAGRPGGGRGGARHGWGGHASRSSSTNNRSATSHVNSTIKEMRDRIGCWYAMLVGQMVVVSLQNGERHVGVVSAATVERDDSGLVLMMAQSMVNTESGVIQWGGVVPSLVVPGADLLEVDASAVKQSSPAEVQAAQRRVSGFRTDTEISSSASASSDGRALQRWDDGGAPETASLEQSTDSGPWDQFAANEARFGVKSDYEETMYTTKLDRSGKDFKSREKEAERLAKEILESSTANVHMAEERNQVDQKDMDEEDRFGAVVREERAPAPPPPKPSKALTADFRQFVSAERERLVVRKAELAKKEKQSRLTDLKVWAQNFQLKTPVPEDVANMKRLAASKRPTTTPSKGVEEARAKLANMTIPAIPPFKKPQEKPTSKLSAKAASFNPQAASFTPRAKTSSSTAPAPEQPFFGTRELKNRPGSTSMRIMDEFRAPKTKKLGEASKVSVWWSYAGRPFRQLMAISNMFPSKAPMPKPMPSYDGAMPMAQHAAMFPVAAAAPYAPSPGLSPVLQHAPSPSVPHGTSPTMLPRPPSATGGSKAPQAAPVMMPPPGPQGQGSPQPYAFMYPMGQYYIPYAPADAQVAPFMYRPPPADAVTAGRGMVPPMPYAPYHPPAPSSPHKRGGSIHYRGNNKGVRKPPRSDDTAPKEGS